MLGETTKSKAIALRKKGMSHLEISKALNIAKSTSSLWTKQVVLPYAAKHILILKELKGSEKGRLIRTLKTQSRNEGIRNTVRKEIAELVVDRALARVMAALLYWGEGSKTSNRVSFTNSDPELVAAFLKLFRYGYDLEERKFTLTLHLHAYHNIKKQKRFWSNVAGISTDKIYLHIKKFTGKIKRADYPGCVAINYCDVVKFEELSQVYKNFSLILGGFV